jgi:Maltose operon periplasmic protein precursor (MalM)
MTIIRALVWLVLAALASKAYAERYVVQDDAFGNTDAVAISEVSEEDLEELKRSQESAEAPIINDQASIEGDPSNQAAQVESDPLENQQQRPNEPGLNLDPELQGSAAPQSSATEQGVFPGSVSESSVSTDAVAPGIVPAGAAVSGAVDAGATQSGSGLESSSTSRQTSTQIPAQTNPFEQEYLRSEKQETDEVIKRLRALRQQSDYDATEVNPADFVDSEDLLQGKVNRTGEQPFYLTLDAQGDEDVVFYSPEVIRQEMERRKVVEQISDSAIHLPPATSQNVSLPANAQPEALAIFNSVGRKTYYERFAERCCNDLPNVGVVELTLEQSAYVDLAREDFSYRFVDGDSRYGLVRLPSLNKKYLLVLKSFVRRFEDRGIDNGVFIPQVVVLDGEKQVKRIISNLSMQANKETWSSYGFLKAVIEVDQTELNADRFLLIYTSKEDLRRYTVIDDVQSPWQIKHMEVGAVEVEVVAESLSQLN